MDLKISKPKKILLTGSRGFTGKHLLNEAVSQGLEIIGLQSDITDVITLEKEVYELAPDAVIHCAGISFVASKDQEAFYRVHALGTSNLLNALTKLPIKPKKVLLASSATVYGNAALTPTPEDYPLKPIDHYAMSKVAMEEMAKTFYDRLPIVIARPFNYTGPGQHDNFLIPKLIRHFAQKSPSIELGNLNVEREFNDVSTICQAYFALLKHGKSGEVYNVGTGKVRSLGFAVETLIRLTNHPIQITVNPDFVRSNEVHRMCGDPSKLNELLTANQCNIHIPELEMTLKSMLDAAHES
ncbi:NAD(P)-dependent oxidoreductase [Polynucleobacter sp. AP-Kaivos-20-H2]|uniref:NAD-dependent epimerase/dehydratase family protein n=1 Tax=Polynucleobacter sp. AP-Kaivos-20-H2 TaxID=2689104 RepID=UPI001C20DA34|nr:NAD-dependent epimerase/dehydratase family protein [Polynucleobacter sp. AP-Kaivos-20-H2]